MRLKILFLFVITAFILSCAHRPDPEKIAADFLSAYLATDYRVAASFCTQKLSDYLSESSKEMDSIENSLKQKIIDRTKNFTSEITSVERNKKGDTVKVLYRINIGGNDSTMTQVAEKQGSLSMIKCDDTWKISSLD